MNYMKPGNVLKRAEEYVGVGKKEQALRVMFEMLSNRRNRTWSQTHEKVMMRYIELCVQMKNNGLAKEGLHQYRNLSLQQAPGSLENVIEYMLKLAIDKATEASALCTTKGLNDVQDLENDKTPESVLLETVTSDKTKERTEREFLVPWLKFLWESFRTVLEILRNNSKMEHVYHETAHRAFKFCKDYERATEFRRLCEILRNHLQKAQQYSKEKDPTISIESMELHLATRFDQLKVASSLRIWHEGFRTIEDIHYIMTISNKRPSSQLMATYYQKLTQLFLVAENYLFHAYAYKAFYYLSREKNKSLTKDQIMIMSSSVLLAAMSIPLQAAKAGTTFAEEGMQKEKNRRMAQLLGFDINPRRRSILEELLNQGILDAVIPEVKQLYLILEEEFSPLDLVQRVIPLLKVLSGQKKLQSYVRPLETLLVVRLLSQLADIYYSVKLDYFKALLSDLDMPFMEIEKTVIKAVKARQVTKLNVHIDHRAGCLRFGEDVMEEDRTRSLLIEMTRGLQAINKELEPNELKLERRKNKAILARTVLSEVNRQHELILERKTLIEQRKEEFERMEADKALQEQIKREEIEAERQRAEQERLEKQRVKREQEKAEQLRDEERLFQIRQEMVAEGIDIKGSDITSMTTEERNNLIEETRRKAQKASIEVERKINAASKKLDSTVRALREVERPKLKEKIAEDLKATEKAFNDAWAEELKSGETKHREALAMKAQLSPIQKFRAEFEAPLLEVWRAECEVQRKNLIAKIQLEQGKGKLERGRKRKKEADMRRIREEQKRKHEEAEARRKKEEAERRERERLAYIERKKQEDELKAQSAQASQRWMSRAQQEGKSDNDRPRFENPRILERGDIRGERGDMRSDIRSRDMGGRDMGGRDMGGRDMGGRDMGGRDMGGRDMRGGDRNEHGGGSRYGFVKDEGDWRSAPAPPREQREPREPPRSDMASTWRKESGAPVPEPRRNAGASGERNWRDGDRAPVRGGDDRRDRFADRGRDGDRGRFGDRGRSKPGAADSESNWRK